MDKKLQDTEIAKPSSAGSQTVITSYDRSGKVLLVNKPIDIVYLCHKMEAAKKKPIISKDNKRCCQRQVTIWIREDAHNFNYMFPYCGEVGYNMTTEPPSPIISEREKFRPSRYPISQYRAIYRKYRKLNSFGDPDGAHRFEFGGADVNEALVSKTHLENSLSLKRSSNNDIAAAYRTINPDVADERFPNGRGMVRIPDVIKKKNHLLLGEEGYSTDNIDTVIEIKFPGDSLSAYQRYDYFKIASNDIKKFRLMTLDLCQYRRRRREEEEMLENAKADPVYGAIGANALANPLGINLIERRIKEEYDAFTTHIVKWVKQQEEIYSAPQLIARDDYNQQLLQDAWQRYDKQREQVLNAPLAAVGVAIAGAAAIAPATSSALTTATLSRSGAEIFKFTPITKAVVAATSAAALPLAASYQSNHQLNRQPNHRYIVEPNGQLTYYENATNSERFKDDRLIELDYAYQRRHLPTFIHDSFESHTYNEYVRFDESGRKIHYYPDQQQFYYYFTPGDEPILRSN